MKFDTRWYEKALPSVLLLATLAWSGAVSAQSAAQRAVDAAKPLCAGGKTITIVWKRVCSRLIQKTSPGRCGKRPPAARST